MTASHLRGILFAGLVWPLGEEDKEEKEGRRGCEVFLMSLLVFAR